MTFFAGNNKIRALSNKGFSLIECLLAVSAFTIVTGAIYTTLVTENRCYWIQTQYIEMQGNVRTGIETLTQDLIRAGLDQTGTAGAGILSASASTIRFTADLNGDGDLSDTDEDLTFIVDGDQEILTRNGTLLARHIPSDGLALTYYDEDNIQLTPPLTPSELADIRRISIQLTGKSSKPDPTYGYRTMDLLSDVSPRNLLF